MEYITKMRDEEGSSGTQHAPPDFPLGGAAQACQAECVWTKANLLTWDKRFQMETGGQGCMLGWSLSGSCSFSFQLSFLCCS